MTIQCDLCRAPLQINSGGQSATCTGCGLRYPMERLREKLSGSHPTPPPPTPVSIPAPAPDPDPEPEPIPAPDPTPIPTDSFAMELRPGKGDLSGTVLQGGIGLGDKVYIDMDYRHPYTVYSINDDPDVTSVQAGDHADLFVRERIPRKVLRSARLVTGVPDPVPSAYNAPGPVQDYFFRLLRQEFGECELRRDVILTDPAFPADFLLGRDNRPVGAVFLIRSDDTRARRHVERQVEALRAKGLGATHFFLDYRNDAPYVIRRLREALA